MSAPVALEERMDATLTSAVSARPAVLASRVEERPRWSARRTIAFVVLTCGGFWLGVTALLSVVARAF